MSEFEFLKLVFGAGIIMSLIRIIYNKINTDIKKVTKEIELLEKKINEIEIYMFKNCLDKNDFKENIKYLSSKLDKILSKTK